MKWIKLVLLDSLGNRAGKSFWINELKLDCVINVF
jgi:hypothetical protein